MSAWVGKGVGVRIANSSSDGDLDYLSAECTCLSAWNEESSLHGERKGKGRGDGKGEEREGVMGKERKGKG